MTNRAILRRRLRLVWSMPVLLAVVAGCANHVVPPDWQTNAQSALKNFSAAYLSGNSRGAEQDFARAREQIASTGRADLIARAELVRCATRVASLEFDDCAGYAPFAADADAAERSYAAFLTGHWDQLDVALLPMQHHAVVRITSGADVAGVLSGIQDPLARLVAAGSLLQVGRLTPSAFVIATDTASAQGWRRPLLAWLEVRLRTAQQSGDAATVEAIKHRIAVVTTALH